MADRLKRKLFGNPMLIRGGPGSGKTSIGLIAIIGQLPADPDTALIIIDCDNDPTWSDSVRTEAERNRPTD
jgi:hypothetical protein